jgi:hypothetical protein
MNKGQFASNLLSQLMTYFNNHQYIFLGGISSTKYFKVEAVLQAFTVLPSRRNRLINYFCGCSNNGRKNVYGASADNQDMNEEM